MSGPVSVLCEPDGLLDGVSACVALRLMSVDAGVHFCGALCLQ